MSEINEFSLIINAFTGLWLKEKQVSDSKWKSHNKNLFFQVLTGALPEEAHVPLSFVMMGCLGIIFLISIIVVYKRNGSTPLNTVWITRDGMPNVKFAWIHKNFVHLISKLTQHKTGSCSYNIQNGNTTAYSNTW